LIHARGKPGIVAGPVAYHEDDVFCRLRAVVRCNEKYTANENDRPPMSKQ
jgi:hypothetical protein